MVALVTRIAVTVALLCLLIGATYWMGGRDDRLRDEIDNRDTLERMENETDPNLDDGGVVDWLREFAK